MRIKIADFPDDIRATDVPPRVNTLTDVPRRRMFELVIGVPEIG